MMGLPERSMRRTAFAPALLLSLFLPACGDSSTKNEVSPGAGGDMDTGGTGGASASGETGGSGGGGAGTGNRSGGAGSSPEIDISQIDFTLAGLNGDLPEPTINCVEGTASGCISVTGIANGQPFEFSCEGGDISGGTDGLINTVGCNGQGAGEEEILLILRSWRSVPSLLEPSHLSGPASSQYDAMVLFFWGDNYVVDAEHQNFVEGRIAGWAEPVDDNPENGHARGTFAATWTDEVEGDPECSTFRKCGPARIRGSFQWTWKY